MGMDKKLQCLVGLTWWNLLQCTWGELEWPAASVLTYFRTISSSRRQIWEKFSDKSFPAAANLDEVVRCGWCTLTLCSSKKHCIQHLARYLHTENCTFSTNIVHWLFSAHGTPCRGHCTQHTYDLILHCTRHNVQSTLQNDTLLKEEDVYSLASGCGFATLLMTPLGKRLCGNSCDQSWEKSPNKKEL